MTGAGIDDRPGSGLDTASRTGARGRIRTDDPRFTKAETLGERARNPHEHAPRGERGSPGVSPGVSPAFPSGAGLVVDLFAGGGGASTGIEAALGRPVDLAVNHSAVAIAVHEANHAGTRHLTSDVYEVDPLEATRGEPVALLWASPDCTHFSRAKGSRPDRPRSKKIRALAWVVVRWAKAVRPRVICLENVEEFLTWGPLGKDGQPLVRRAGDTFRAWVRALERLGYVIDWRVLDASKYGAPTRRKRLFVVARCDGRAVRWPEPTHGPGLLPYRTAGECIDWTIPTRSIFGRKRPLAEKTMQRIAEGIRRFVLENPRPYIVRVNHGRDVGRVQTLDDPLTTVEATQRGHAVVTPYVVKWRHDSAGASLTAPLPTITSGGNAGGRPAGAAHAMGIAEVGLVAPVQENAQHDGDRSCAADGRGWRPRDPIGRDDLAAPQPECDGVLRTEARGDEEQARLLARAGVPGRQALSGGGAPSRLDGASRTDPRGPGHQSQGRAPDEQPPEQPRARDAEREPPARLSSARQEAFEDGPEAGRSRDPGARPRAARRGHGVRDDRPDAEREHRDSTQGRASPDRRRLVAAWGCKHFGGVYGQHPDEPIGTVTARDHHGPVAAALVKFRGDPKDHPGGGSLDEPMPTITAGGLHLAECRAFLTKWYSSKGTKGASLFDPAPTATAKARFGVVVVEGVEYEIGDIFLRMLEPEELLRAQFGEFAQGYDLGPAVTKEAKTRLVGNSVCPHVARALVLANVGSAEEAAA
jgi:DNA (cytosine-5)-methyltransferase 1